MLSKFKPVCSSELLILKKCVPIENITSFLFYLFLFHEVPKCSLERGVQKSVKPFLVPVGKNRHSVDDSAIMASIVIICCQFVVGNGCVVK